MDLTRFPTWWLEERPAASGAAEEGRPRVYTRYPAARDGRPLLVATVVIAAAIVAFAVVTSPLATPAPAGPATTVSNVDLDRGPVHKNP